MPTISSSQSDQLYRTILKLQTLDEVRAFFRDLLTDKEIEEFSKRWQAAQMLNANISYTNIIKETGLSSTTVARIAKWLNGEVGGYRLALSKNHHHAHPRLG